MTRFCNNCGKSYVDENVDEFVVEAHIDSIKSKGKILKGAGYLRFNINLCPNCKKELYSLIGIIKEEA